MRGGRKDTIGRRSNGSHGRINGGDVEGVAAYNPNVCSGLGFKRQEAEREREREKRRLSVY